MPTIADIVDWTKNRLIYMSGRGLLGLGLVAATWFVPGAAALFEGSVLALMGTVMVGTLCLQGYITYRNERTAENRLVTAYRDEVAAKLGMEPNQVTLEHVKDVANGQPELGLDGNPVLKQALDVTSKRYLMQFATTAASAVLVFFSVLTANSLLFPDMNILKELGDWMKGGYDAINLGFLGSQVAVVGGGMFVAGAGMGLLNQAFDRIGERVLGIAGKTTNQYIMDIKRDISRGHIIPHEQVFEVYVSADKVLAAKIEQEFGRPYQKMNQRQQHLALEEFGAGLNIRQVTFDINHRLIEPEELAFKAVGQESGVPRQKDSSLREEALKETTVRDLLEEAKRAAIGGDLEQEKDHSKAAANDNVEGFAKRFAPRETEAKTHVEKYAANKQDRTVSFVEKEAERMVAQPQNPGVDR